MASTAYTVVIPAYNAAKTLAEAIDSLRRQTLPPDRIVVVDDGSQDATLALASALGPDVVATGQPNAGPGAATTRGIALVETPLIAFLDADDLWLADKAHRQVARLDAEPDLAGVCARARLFRSGQTVEDSAPVQDIWGRSSLMMRTAAARLVGPVIDPPGLRGDMVDWLQRARERGQRIDMMPDVLLLRRVAAGSLAFGRSARDTGYLHVIKAALDRRRGAGS